MARIFISYSRKDAEETAEGLRTKLSLANHIVWRDIEDLRGGLPWKDQLKRQIEAVHCVIVLLTPEGTASEAVEFEWTTALAIGKRVIPIYILPCTVPDELLKIHYHTATDPDSYEHMLIVLLRDLAELDKHTVAEHQVAEEISPELTAYVQSAIRAYSQRLREKHQIGTNHVPSEPYKELYAFELEDEQIFFGRGDDTKRLKRVVLRDRLAVLHARSGAGKTSLINAGLMPLLITGGFVPIYARTHTDPVEAIKRAVTSALPQKPPTELQKLTLHQFLRIAEVSLGVQSREIVIVLDQFEEFFVLYPQYEQRWPIANALAECYEDLTLRARFLLAIRKDYFSDLGEFQERLPGVYLNEFRLPNLTREQAMEAITGPVHTVDPSVSYDPTLLHELLTDLETSGMELPHLQIICSQLYNDRPEQQNLISLTDYDGFGRAKGILGNYLTRTLNMFPVEERDLAKRVLTELVSSQSTKRILPRETLIAVSRGAASERVDAVLDRLVDARLLRRDRDEENGITLYEMAHEYLVEEISRWFDAGMMSVKQTEELLQRAVIDWKIHGILMSRPMLERVFQERESLQLADDALLCVLLSSIQENYEAKYWINRESEKSLNLLRFIFEDETAFPSRLRGRIVSNLIHLGEKAIPLLFELLGNKDQGIRRRSIDVLELTRFPLALGAVYLDGLNISVANIQYSLLSAIGNLFYSRNPQEVNEATYFLEQLTDETSVDVLVQLLNTISYKDSLYPIIITALERIGTLEAKSYVNRAVHRATEQKMEEERKQEERKRLERERLEREKKEQEKLERDKKAYAKKERENLERERLERMQKRREQVESVNREREERKRLEREQKERKRKLRKIASLEERKRKIQEYQALFPFKQFNGEDKSFHDINKLVNILKTSPSYHERYRAAQALGASRNRNVIAELLSGLLDENEWVRLATIQALGILGDERIIPFIEEMSYSDIHLDVQRAAWAMLKRLKSNI